MSYKLTFLVNWITLWAIIWHPYIVINFSPSSLSLVLTTSLSIYNKYVSYKLMFLVNWIILWTIIWHRYIVRYIVGPYSSLQSIMSPWIHASREFGSTRIIILWRRPYIMLERIRKFVTNYGEQTDREQIKQLRRPH